MKFIVKLFPAYGVVSALVLGTEANATRHLPVAGRDNKRHLRGLVSAFKRTLQANIDVNAGQRAEAEVMIDINPTNPDNLIICGHEPGFDNMGTWFTTNGGITPWTAVQLGNADDGLASGFRFDPWVVFAGSGDAFVAYGAKHTDAGGTDVTTVVVCRSTDGGASYPTCTNVDTSPDELYPPFPDPFPGNDRWSMATGPDPSDSTQENIYIVWTNNPGGRQDIVLSRSTDNGVSFSAPLVVNDASANGNLEADVSVGPNGELYVTWNHINQGEIMFDISTDGGLNFGTDSLIASSSTGFKAKIPAQPDRGIFVGPYVDVDRSGGAFDGRLHLIYTDVGPGGGDNIDILTQWSSDQGTTWNGPVTVNDDGGTNSQFLPYLDVDQVTGTVAAVWYDARNDPGNVDVEVFMSISTDGGVTWETNIRIADNASTEGATTNNFLEYIGVAGWNSCFHVVWTDNSANNADNDYFTDFICFNIAANAGPDQTLECSGPNTPVSLDSSGSTGSPIEYTWRENGVIIANGPDPTVQLDVGVHTIELTVEGINGLDGSATDTVVVTVQDTTPPVLTLLGPASTTLECGIETYIELGFTVSDVCDPTPQVDITQSIDPRTLGAYVVTYDASDASDNTSQEERDVVVQDTTPPVLTLLGPASITLECGVDNYIEQGFTVSDVCDPTPQVDITQSIDPGTPGVYVVTYDASDASDNTSQEEREVIVQDTIPPVILLTSTEPMILWPPNHKFEMLEVSTLVAAVSDICDTTLTVDNVKVYSVSSDEPKDGTGDGSTEQDVSILISDDCSKAQVRKERQGSGNGRVYTTDIRLADASSNVGGGLFEAHVPKNNIFKRNKTGAVTDDGPAYTVLGGCPL